MIVSEKMPSCGSCGRAVMPGDKVVILGKTEMSENSVHRLCLPDPTWYCGRCTKITDYPPKEIT